MSILSVVNQSQSTKELIIATSPFLELSNHDIRVGAFDYLPDLCTLFQETGPYLPLLSHYYDVICNRSEARVRLGQEQKLGRRGSRSLSTARARALGQSRARQVMMLPPVLPFALFCLLVAVLMGG